MPSSEVHRQVPASPPEEIHLYAEPEVEGEVSADPIECTRQKLIKGFMGIGDGIKINPNFDAQYIPRMHEILTDHPKINERVPLVNAIGVTRGHLSNLVGVLAK